nr:PREDICTED: uncharacterized protein LOC109041995 [Bemisia tabaci]
MMELLLKSWSVDQNIIDKFIEADIDLELLKGLEDKDYLSFFPTVGSKIRFRCKLEEWKNKNAAQEAASSKESDESVSHENDEVVSNSEPTMAINSQLQRPSNVAGMRYKPPSHDAIRNDSILETIAQNLSADSENTSLKESLSNVDDLKQLLRDSILGCGILSYYESNQCLTKFYEKEVSKIVITHELQCDSRSKITSAKLLILRDLLVQVFPSIEAEKWYSPFKVGPSGERHYAAGKLQEQYLYIRKILLGSGLTVSLKRQKGNQPSQYSGAGEGSSGYNMFDFLSYDDDSRPEMSFVETVTSPGFPNSDSLSSHEVGGLGSQASTPDINSNSPEIFFRCAEYDSNLRKRFFSMFSTGRMTDITIACEGKRIKCHQLMLCACSHYFDELLFENPSQHPLVFLKDVKFWELRTIIDFIYTGELKISIERLPMLLAAAECLQIKDLIENLRMPDNQSSSRTKYSDSSNSDLNYSARIRSNYHQNEGRSRKSHRQSGVDVDVSNSCHTSNIHDRQNLKAPSARISDAPSLKRIKVERPDHHTDYEMQGSGNQGYESWPS